MRDPQEYTAEQAAQEAFEDEHEPGRPLAPGTKVKLVKFGPACIDDNQFVPSGTVGTVSMVDSFGTIHVDWENGPKLGLIPGHDQWEVVKP